MILAFLIGYVVGVVSFVFYVEPTYRLVDKAQAYVLQTFFKYPPLTHKGVVVLLASLLAVTGALAVTLINVLFL